MVHVLMTLDTEFSAKSTVDDTVIQEIANGNMNAFHRLYENISRSVYGFALSITKNTYDAEDVLQDTFLTIYRKPEITNSMKSLWHGYLPSRAIRH